MLDSIATVKSIDLSIASAKSQVKPWTARSYYQSYLQKQFKRHPSERESVSEEARASHERECRQGLHNIELTWSAKGLVFPEVSIPSLPAFELFLRDTQHSLKKAKSLRRVASLIAVAARVVKDPCITEWVEGIGWDTFYKLLALTDLSNGVKYPPNPCFHEYSYPDGLEFWFDEVLEDDSDPITLDVATLISDIQVNNRYLTGLAMPDTKFVAIRSPKGTGKTSLMREWLSAKGSVIAVTMRVALAKKNAIDYDLHNYQSLTTDLDKAHRVAIQVDSLARLSSQGLHRFKGGTVVIDEASQFLRHLTGDTLKNKRLEILVILRSLVAIADKVILMDADLTQQDINHFQKLLDKQQPSLTIIDNIVKANNRTYVEYSSKDQVIHQLVAGYDAGKKVFGCADTLQEAKTMASALRTQGASVLLVTSETTSEAEVIGFLENPGLIAGYDALVCSPSLGTGFDVNLVHFDSCYLSGSFLSATELHQMTARVRQLASGLVHWNITAKSIPQAPLPKQEPLAYDFDQDGNRVPLQLELDQWLNELCLSQRPEPQHLSLRLQFELQAIAEGGTCTEEQIKVEKVDRITKSLELEKKIARVLSGADVEELDWVIATLRLAPDVSLLGLEEKLALITEEQVRYYFLYPQAPRNLLTAMAPMELAKAMEKVANAGKATADHNPIALRAKVISKVLELLDVFGDTQSISDKCKCADWLASNKAAVKKLGVRVEHGKPAKTLIAILALVGLEVIELRTKWSRSYQITPESLAIVKGIQERGTDSFQSQQIAAINYKDLGHLVSDSVHNDLNPLGV